MDTVISRFKAIVDVQPESIALHTKSGGLITYQELDVASNKIANAILATRGEDNDPVALMCEQGEKEQIEAILGTLKARKTVLSLNVDRRTQQWGQRSFLEHGFLDQSYVRELFWNAAPELILCDHKHLLPAMEIANGMRVLNTSLDFKGAAHDPNIEIKPNDLNAILHTTGTTGEPKAVLRPHSMEVRNIDVANETDHVGPDDRVTLFRSASTGAMADIFFALLNGARLCPYQLDSGDLTDWINREKITVFRSVCTVFRMLDYERGGGFPHVRLINIGGESITQADVENYRKYFPDTCKLVVRYSSSETGHICHYEITKDTKLNGEVPVGYPLGDTRKIIIVDGEIIVRDQPEYLFAGYLNNPKLTREKMSDGYHTWDKGYFREDGALVHQGRIR
jgi:acyl-coenzyme A synthetase/AMP-(fatty) acid ligase